MNWHKVVLISTSMKDRNEKMYRNNCTLSLKTCKYKIVLVRSILQGQAENSATTHCMNNSCNQMRFLSILVYLIELASLPTGIFPQLQGILQSVIEELLHPAILDREDVSCREDVICVN